MCIRMRGRFCNSARRISYHGITFASRKQASPTTVGLKGAPVEMDDRVFGDRDSASRSEVGKSADASVALQRDVAARLPHETLDDAETSPVPDPTGLVVKNGSPPVRFQIYTFLGSWPGAWAHLGRRRARRTVEQRRAAGCTGSMR